MFSLKKHRSTKKASVKSKVRGKGRTFNAPGRRPPPRLSFQGSGKKRKKKRKSIKGRGIFKNIQQWFTKTALGITPLPGLQRELKPTVWKKGWKKPRPLQMIPRAIWKATGVPNKVLNRFEYAKASDFKK